MPKASEPTPVLRRVPEAANLDPQAVGFYRHAVTELRRASVKFLVGGAWAFEAYTDIPGRTKDLDLFLRASDVEQALAALAGAGYETELTSPVWIGKAWMGDNFVDLIFNSGNGACPVDDGWFEHSPRVEVLGYRLPLVPIEEMIWQKAFLMERDRFDGADIVHLIRAAQGKLDGDRLLRRFGIHWRVLLAHVLLFDYVYPSERGLVPDAMRHELVARARGEVETTPADGRPDVRLCYGTYLSRHQFTDDVERFGFTDARRA
jgi:hypothetical protein